MDLTLGLEPLVSSSVIFRVTVFLEQGGYLSMKRDLTEVSSPIEGLLVSNRSPLETLLRHPAPLP